MVEASEKTEVERKAELHACVDALEGAQVELARRALLRLEAEKLLTELSAVFDEARRDGRMTDESIQAAIAEHRAKHPYR